MPIDNTAPAVGSPGYDDWKKKKASSQRLLDAVKTTVSAAKGIRRGMNTNQSDMLKQIDQ